MVEKPYLFVAASCCAEPHPPHDLRHAYATLLLTRGVHPRSFRELLDHCSISIALDTYYHILLDMKDHLTRTLEDALSWRVAVRLQYKNRDTLAGPLLCGVLPAKCRYLQVGDAGFEPATSFL
jgi:integrase